MNEIWKTTTVNKDYEVSNLGNIRSNKKATPRLLKPFPSGSNGGDGKGRYMSVRLLANGVERDYSVHRLVAMAYIDNPNNLPFVNHKNGIRDDNRVENLEWCDGSYNTWHSYNVLGNTNGLAKAVCQYTKGGDFVREWESASEAERETQIDGASITEVCRKNTCRKTAGGFIWRYKRDEEVILSNEGKKKIGVTYHKTFPVVQISKYGERLKTFDSVREAAKEVGVTEGGVTGVCMKRTRGYNYAGGYLWRYEDEYDENEFGYFVDKTFVQMTMNNIFVNEYKGTHDLVDNGGFKLVKVIMCCRGKRNSTDGFKWCIKEEGDRTRLTKRERPVVKFDKQMNYLCEYPSAVVASKDVNIPSTNIARCCAVGTHTSAAGFRWMYKEDYEKTIDKWKSINY